MGLLDFLARYKDIFLYLFVLLFTFVLWLLNGKTKKMSDILAILEENFMLKPKSQHYLTDTKTDKSLYQQDFTGSELEPVYRYNERTGELEDTGEFVDLQEKINSYIETCLERALEKYLPSDVVEDDNVSDFTSMKDDLSALAELTEEAESYREKYKLSDDMSISDIYKYVDVKASELKQQIEQQKQKQQQKTQKEDNKNEA